MTPQLLDRAPVQAADTALTTAARLWFLVAVIGQSLLAILVWIKGGTVGGLVQHIGVSINAILIMFCAAMALRYALARQLAIHRRWALRLYLVVSGVWFFRVGLLFWIIVNHGPVGFNPQTFEGPFLDFLTFAQYLLPLAVLELYLRTQDHAAAPGKYAMGIGIFGATMGMWLPRIY